MATIEASPSATPTRHQASFNIFNDFSNDIANIVNQKVQEFERNVREVQKKTIDLQAEKIAKLESELQALRNAPTSPRTKDTSENEDHATKPQTNQAKSISMEDYDLLKDQKDIVARQLEETGLKYNAIRDQKRELKEKLVKSEKAASRLSDTVERLTGRVVICQEESERVRSQQTVLAGSIRKIALQHQAYLEQLKKWNKSFKKRGSVITSILNGDIECDLTEDQRTSLAWSESLPDDNIQTGLLNLTKYLEEHSSERIKIEEQRSESMMQTPKPTRTSTDMSKSSTRSLRRKRRSSVGHDSDMTVVTESESMMDIFSPTNRAVTRGPGPNTCAMLFPSSPPARVVKEEKEEEEQVELPQGTVEDPVHIKSEGSSSSDSWRRQGYYDFSEDNLDLDVIEAPKKVTPKTNRRRKIKADMKASTLMDEESRASIARALSVLEEEDQIPSGVEAENLTEVLPAPDLPAQLPIMNIPQVSKTKPPALNPSSTLSYETFEIAADSMAVKVPVIPSSSDDSPLSSPPLEFAETPRASRERVLQEIPIPNKRTPEAEPVIPKALSRVQQTPSTTFAHGLPTPKTAPPKTPNPANATTPRRKVLTKSQLKNRHKVIRKGIKGIAEDSTVANSSDADTPTGRLESLMKTPQHDNKKRNLPDTPDTMARVNTRSKRPLVIKDDPTEFKRRKLGSMSPEKLAEYVTPKPITAANGSHLRPEDFIINPSKNNGLDYAYTEPIRTAAAKNCLPSCTKTCCKDVTKISKIWGPPPAPTIKPLKFRSSSSAAADDDGEPRSSSQDDHSREAEDEVMRHIRHKEVTHGRRTPPRFWESEFPSTQEVVEQHRMADKMLEEEGRRRLRNSKKGGVYMLKER